MYKPAVANAVFPALAAHLHGTRFRYLDNVEHEATFMNVLIGRQSVGKGSIKKPIEFIMEDIRRRDIPNRQREAEWKQKNPSAKQKKDPRPTDICIQILIDNLTDAVFNQRIVDAHNNGERYIYTIVDEIEALKKVYAQDRLTLERQLRASERDGRNLVKGRNALIVALAMAEDDAAGFEDEVVELEESNNALKDAMGEKYAEGFAAALDQVNVLFPDLDEAVLSQVDLLKFVEDGKLVSRIPEAEPVGSSGPELVLAAREDDGLSPLLEKNSGEVVSGAET
jgi:hypothetical protein